MTEHFEGRGLHRLSPLFVPAAAISISLIASLFILGDMFSDSLDQAALSGIEQIEFVVRRESPEAIALHSTLDRACAETGCNADLLSPMILASAASMTSDDLEEAMSTQSRIQDESQAIRERTLRGTPTARLAEMEILAAERIIALYELELAER